MSSLDKINRNNVPQHIAIIMDGNGRWARQQGHDRLFGHNTGVESVREALRGAQQVGVKYLTLYAFSTENWNRPKEEVDGLMNLLVSTITAEVDELHQNGVRITTIGDFEGLPDSCQLALNEAKQRTSNNTGVNLILALNYSSRWELVQAAKTLAQQCKEGSLDVADINADKIAQHLCTYDVPDPELMIRTSGEHRISNFLLWQLAYTELHFTDILWPDFKEEDLYQAILDYQSRERRFGMVSEQITK